MLEQSLFFIVLLAIFIAGILFDKYLLCNSQSYEKPKGFFDKQKTTEKVYKNNIEIDEKTIVIGIETANMEPKHDELGQTIELKDNTQSAINKLKSMKGK